MRQYGHNLLAMPEYVEKTCMQKEEFMKALSVKLRVRVNLFRMCFIRIRANLLPNGSDQGQCCNMLSKDEMDTLIHQGNASVCDGHQ